MDLCNLALRGFHEKKKGNLGKSPHDKTWKGIIVTRTVTVHAICSFLNNAQNLSHSNIHDISYAWQC